MTVQRTIAIGFGGAVAVIVAVAVGSLVGVFALAIALWMGRVRRATLASGWAERGLATVRLTAFVVSATAIVEGIGGYPPLEVVHNIMYVNLPALLILLLGFLFIAAVGVGRLIRGASAPRST